jgi:hypothetical protein
LTTKYPNQTLNPITITIHHYAGALDILQQMLHMTQPRQIQNQEALNCWSVTPHFASTHTSFAAL